MRGLRSTIQRLGFFVSPGKYRSVSSLFVINEKGVKKVANFFSDEGAEDFITVLEKLFEEEGATWDLIGPCKDWSNWEYNVGRKTKSQRDKERKKDG